MKGYCIALTLLLTSCDTPAPTPKSAWQEMSGRAVSAPIYRARVPDSWQRIDPAPDAQLADTMLPICTFTIPGEVTITVHNFPSNSADERIPPAAQIARWQRQLGRTTGLVSPVAHAGFVGLMLEDEGMLAWTLQLDRAYYRLLSRDPENIVYKEMRSDVTIKAVGPVASHGNEIKAFAQSFELIQELPSPL